MVGGLNPKKNGGNKVCQSNVYLKNKLSNR